MDFSSIDRLAKIYIYMLCVDTGCSLEDQPIGTDDESVKGIHTVKTVMKV